MCSLTLEISFVVLDTNLRGLSCPRQKKEYEVDKGKRVNKVRIMEDTWKVVDSYIPIVVKETKHKQHKW